MIDERQIAAWRAETPGCAHRVHLNNAGAALMTRRVSGAIRDYIDFEAVAGGYEAADLRQEQIADSYATVATLCGTTPEHIAVTSSATAAFVQAASAFDFQPGDVLVTSRLDYTSYQIQYLSLAERCGVTVVHAPDLLEGGIDPQGVRELLRSNPRCRMVSVSWIPTHAGTIQDVAAVGAACEEFGVPYHVDACQAVGQLPIEVGALKCDYLSATGCKFLRGPRGTGFLYVSERALRRGDRPLYIDMRGARWSSPHAFEPVPDARRFEEWEFAYALVLGLGEAARYAVEAGIERCGARAHALAREARERLSALPGATVLDRGRHLSALVTVSFDGRDAKDVAAALAARGINTVATLRWYGMLDLGARGVESAIRVSPHYYNTSAELDLLIAALEEILAGA
jgi:selenocysteine lyase/cysteine desulfurase